MPNLSFNLPSALAYITCIYFLRNPQVYHTVIAFPCTSKSL